MKKQENIINKCGECARYKGGDKGFDCQTLMDKQINNPRVDKESRACCDIEKIIKDKEKSIFFGLMTIKF
jgi:hypothetical protein